MSAPSRTVAPKPASRRPADPSPAATSSADPSPAAPKPASRRPADPKSKSDRIKCPKCLLTYPSVNKTCPCLQHPIDKVFSEILTQKVDESGQIAFDVSKEKFNALTTEQHTVIDNYYQSLRKKKYMPDVYNPEKQAHVTEQERLAQEAEAKAKEQQSKNADLQKCLSEARENYTKLTAEHDSLGKNAQKYALDSQQTVEFLRAEIAMINAQNYELVCRLQLANYTLSQLGYTAV